MEYKSENLKDKHIVFWRAIANFLYTRKYIVRRVNEKAMQLSQ